MEHIKKQADNLQKLTEKIKHAIDDGHITVTEYDRIMMLADADGVIDPSEQKMLSQLQDMLDDGTIKKIPG